MGVIFLMLFGVLLFVTRNNKSDFQKRKESGLSVHEWYMKNHPPKNKK